MIAQVIVAHLVGDYLLQSHYMATEKVKRWWPALVHGFFYTLPFLFITLNPWALLIIGGTHAIIDRYRLAKHVSWLKNQIAPKNKVYTYIWDGVSKQYDSRYDSADYVASRPIHPNMSVAPPTAKVIKSPALLWEEAKQNAGYPKDTPPWLSTWLMIFTDNTIHILINIAAIMIFGGI